MTGPTLTADEEVAASAIADAQLIRRAAEDVEQRARACGDATPHDILTAAEQVGLPTEGSIATTLGDPNLILMAGTSPEVSAVLAELQQRGQVELRPLRSDLEVLVVYGFDGSPMLTLPRALRPPRGGYRRPHWVPFVLTPRRPS